MSCRTSTLRPRAAAILTCCLAAGSLAAKGQTSFVNWETPQVSPLALTPSGALLLAVNTADNRLEVFDLPSGVPTRLLSIPVGLDPVSVRARTESEVWVVNHVSDSISIIDLPTGRVTRTLLTGDEPTDVVFAGTPQRAFVTLSQLNQVRVWDPANLGTAPTVINIEGEDPRSLAVSPDGSRVYAAIFESGNPTTIVRQQDVTLPAGPYGGVNPPPNSGNAFNPPMTVGLPPGPPVAQIVRRDAAGRWRDDNNRDWTQFIPWNLHDHDVAIIDANSLAVTYASSMLTTVMGLAVRPDGAVTVVGTEAGNERRFESNLRGTFLRVRLGSFSPATPATTQTLDLNPHLNYTTASIPEAQRQLSVGDPRAVVWRPAGGTGFIAGMGSNNIVAIDSAGTRLATIPVGQGPTGLALNPVGTVLYALNRFDATISVIDPVTFAELTRVPFFDPTPDTIRQGRPLLYDTHATSGLGHISCASCHVDGRTDFLAWDLGNPAGSIKPFNQDCRQPVCADWHPMKGPMVTQTLIGIVGVEPLHWRGDREDVAAFAPAFTDLQAADAQPSAGEMQLMTGFLATTRYAPNPNRNIDNSFPAALPTSGGGNGNPVAGLNIYNTLPTVGGAPCVSCHGPVNGSGSNQTIDFPNLPLFPQPLKIAQLRNMHEKTGFNKASQSSNRGFGFNHHSEFDTMNALFQAGFAFAPGAPGAQQRRDVEALMLAFSNHTHAGVGQQIGFTGPNNNDPNAVARLNTFVAQADLNAVGLVASGRIGGVVRGYVYVGAGVMQSDRAGETTTITALRTGAAAGAEVTFTMAAAGTQMRVGIDRDADGSFDRDELENCGDPANGAILAVARGDVNIDGARNAADLGVFVSILLSPDGATAQQRCAADTNRDGTLDGLDIEPFIDCVLAGLCT